METTLINRLPELIEADITSGKKLPMRDSTNNRIFNFGEKAILKSWRKKTNEVVKSILDAMLKLKKIEARGKLYRDAANAQHERYLDEKNAHENKILEYKKAIEKHAKTLDFYHRLNGFRNRDTETNQQGMEQSMKKVNLWSNIWIVILIETIVSFATWAIQRESLGLESIIVRIVFLFSIGMASVYQLYLYQKTGKRLLKIMHDIVLLLGFVCIIDGLFVGYFLGNVSTSPSTDFNLDPISIKQQINKTEGITYFMINFPGIFEFLTAVLITLYGKMMAVPKMKTTAEVTSPTTKIESSVDMKIALINNAIADLNKKIEEENTLFSRIEEENAIYLKESQTKCAEFEANKAELDDIISQKTDELKALLDQVLENMAYYRSCLLEALSLKLDVPPHSLPPYELATESDIKNFYSINL